MRLPPSPSVPPAVELHCCQLDDDRDIDFGEALESLAPPEVTRSARFVYRRDAERYIRGRGFMRRVLGEHLGIAARHVEIRAWRDGKPHVPGGTLDFNLTHSSDWALLAVSPLGPVGIDLELRSGPVRNWEDLLDTGRLCFVQDEMDVLRGLCGELRLERFLAFWTAKEARMKLLGEGMRMDPKTIILRLAGGEPVGYRHEPIEVTLHRIQTGLPEALCHLAYAGQLPDQATPERPVDGVPRRLPEHDLPADLPSLLRFVLVARAHRRTT